MDWIGVASSISVVKLFTFHLLGCKANTNLLATTTFD